MPQPAPPTLSYDTQPPPRWRLTPRAWRGLAIAAVLIALSLYCGLAVCHLSMAEYHEYQWEQYHPALSTIVMDMSQPTAQSPTKLPVPTFAPVPRGWRYFPLADGKNGTLYLGRRNSPNGTPYWVGLAFEYSQGGDSANNGPMYYFNIFNFRGSTASVGSFFHPSDTVWFGDGWHLLRIDPSCDGLFRFYAGQPDPADPCHFTIDYTYDGTPGTIDGNITDAGVIILKPRLGVMLQYPDGVAWNPGHSFP